MKTKLAVLVLILVAAFFGWQAYHQKPVPTWDEHAKKIYDLQSAMEGFGREIRGAGSSECNSSSECKVVGLGAKSCGLHKDYFIYSVLTTNVPHLLELVKRFNETAEKMNDLSFKVLSCGNEPASVGCVDHVCKLN